MTPSAGAPPAGEGAPTSSSALLDQAFADTGSESAEPVEQEQPQIGDEAGETVDQEASDDDNPFENEDAEPEKFEDGADDYRVSPNRWKKHVAARKFATEVQAFAPSVEAAREHYERASDFRHMESDFQTADPQGISEFINYWGGQSPEAMGSVASQILPWLANSQNPVAHQAIQQVETQVTRAMTQRAYDQATRSGNPDDLLKAQNLDFYLNGSFKKPEDLKARPAQQQPQRSNDSAVADRLITNSWNAFNTQQITGAKDTALNQSLDRIFARPEVKSAYGATVLDALRAKVSTEAVAKLASDPEWKRNHEIELRGIQQEYTSALKTGKPTNLQPRIDAVTKDYANRLARVIPQLAKPLLESETSRVLAQSKATNQRLATGAGKSAPAGGGRPTPRSLVDTQKFSNARDLLDHALSQ